MGRLFRLIFVNFISESVKRIAPHRPNRGIHPEAIDKRINAQKIEAAGEITNCLILLGWDRCSEGSDVP